MRFARDLFKAGKPVAAIRHGPWLLVEADVVRGRTVTTYPLRGRSAHGAAVGDGLGSCPGIPARTSHEPEIQMRPLRLLLLCSLLVSPGCLVVTCGTTRSFDTRQESRERTPAPPPPDTRPGTGGGW